MARSEAIAWLKSIKEKYIHGGDDFYDCKRRWAIDYAVSTLEQNPITNADRIRHSSDRALAEFLSSKFAEVGYLSLNEEGHKLTAIEVEAIKHNLFGVFMKWLQQPAE